MAKADRVLALLEALQDHPFASGPQLAQRLGTDERTLRRDVAALRALGIPVEAERGRGGGYRLKPGYRMPPLMFTPAEATTVALGLLAAQRDGLDAAGALAKLRRVLPDGVRLRVEALEQSCASRAPRVSPRRRWASRCWRWPRRPGAGPRARRLHHLGR